MKIIREGLSINQKIKAYTADIIPLLPTRIFHS
jgi:hypothetical protein